MVLHYLQSKWQLQKHAQESQQFKVQAQGSPSNTPKTFGVYGQIHQNPTQMHNEIKRISRVFPGMILCPF